MTNLKDDLTDLVNRCYAIESQLPWNHEYWNGKDDSYAQAVRRELYNIRIQIGNTTSRAKQWGVDYEKQENGFSNK